MKFYISFIVTWICLQWSIRACEQNCYLGSNLYSAPLKGDNCCQTQLRGKCNTFMMISDHDFICRQCQLGYQQIDGECVEIGKEGVEKKKNCYNPDIRSVYFDPCSVCKIDESGVFVPIRDPANPKAFKCEPLAKGSKDAQKLQFCKASANYQDNVLCHECIDNYYYNGQENRCQRETTALKGCLISFVDGKCEICRPEFQYDMRNNRCISKSEKIDYEAYQKEMQKKMSSMSEDNGMGNPMIQQMMMMQMMQAQQGQGGAMAMPTQISQQQNIGNQQVGNINFNASMGSNGYVNGINPTITQQAAANAGPFTRGFYRRK